MAENKFIKHLKGTETAGSVLEIKNQGTPATFGNMPAGTSNPNTVYADARGDATAVLKGTDVWKLNSSTLDLASRVYGDGRDFTDTYTASGSSLWVNATHTFGSAKIFGANTKWVLKLCGANLLSAVADTIDFSLIIKFGSTAVVAKNFTVAEQANNFCQQFVIDFNEWTQNVIKAASGDTMTIQLLCGDSTASATIYNGMTTLTALQRRVDGDVVASDTSTFDDLEQGLDNKVSKTGDTMSGALTFTNATGAGGIFGYTNGVVFFYMNGDTRTPLAAIDNQVFMPCVTDSISLGGASHRWLSATIKTVYTPTLNNGYDIAVPVTNSADTLALKSEVDGKVSKSGDTMTGELLMLYGSRISFRNSTASTKHYIRADGQRTIMFGSGWNASIQMYWEVPTGDLYSSLSTSALGKSTKPWGNVYTAKINNGGDLAVPANTTGTLATKADVDLAANSGDQLTAKGVWYAKMYAATTPPSADNGTNYADFSQVDGNGDPIIVIYERQSGAWVQTDTITPPANYNGYVTVTSKIWDIAEQTGQQGGKVLWSHNQKTFTPYPQIISFEDAALTGNSTVAMPLSPTNDNITNKGYVDSAISGAMISFSPWDLFDFKWKDCTISTTGWALSNGNYITKSSASTAYKHIHDDYDNISSYLHSTGTVSGVNYYRDPSRDVSGATYEYAFSSFRETTVTTVYSDTSAPIGGVDHFYNGSGSSATDLGVLEGGGQASTSLKSTIAYEKIGNTTVVYVTAADGHKICLPDQKTNIDTIYADAGVAWYYVLDNANEQFVLPRTRHAFVGCRDTVGAYVPETLPNVSGSVSSTCSGANGSLPSRSGCMKVSGTGVMLNAGSGSLYVNNATVSVDASLSSSTYQTDAPVQERGTQMYLYFYVGA